MSRFSILALFAFVTLLLSLFTVAYSSQGCSGTINTKPFIYDAPTFVKSTKNGKRFLVGTEEQFSHVVHVYGSPFEMGYAYGELLKDELKQTTEEFMEYVDKQIADMIKVLPKEIAEIIVKFGLNIALDLTWAATQKYTPSHYEEELEGIAAGSKIDVKVIRRLNLFPELIKAHCSIVGVWGDATANSTAPGSLLQLRALDWDPNNVIKRNPTITVYHPNKGNKFVNVAWPGFIGSLTGVSEAMIGIGEKVWLHDRDLDTRFGKPWTYVLRDILQFSNTLEEALDELRNTNRTCSIHLGIGDSKSNEFRGIEYSYKELNIYNWDNHYVSEGHPRMKHVVYWDKHKQPSNNACIGSIIKENYGKIDAELIIRNIAGEHQTGDMQCAVFDYGNRMLYVSNASPDDSSPEMKAFVRPFIVIDLDKLFSEKL